MLIMARQLSAQIYKHNIYVHISVGICYSYNTEYIKFHIFCGYIFVGLHIKLKLLGLIINFITYNITVKWIVQYIFLYYEHLFRFECLYLIYLKPELSLLSS